MPNFRWPLLYHDVSLAKETISLRPKTNTDWDSIGAKLSLLFSKEDKVFIIKGRACRERLDLLLKKYKQEDAKALKRSGTEEEYSDLQQLLEDISSFMKDLAVIRATHTQERAALQKKIEKDKQSGEEMRKAAMQVLSKKQIGQSAGSSTSSSRSGSIDLDLEDGGEEVLEECQSSGKKRQAANGGTPVAAKRCSRLSTLESFQQRHHDRIDLKTRELQLREKELNFQKEKFALEEEARQKRWSLEEAERKQRLENEKEEKRVYLEILQKCLNK